MDGGGYRGRSQIGPICAGEIDSEILRAFVDSGAFVEDIDSDRLAQHARSKRQTLRGGRVVTACLSAAIGGGHIHGHRVRAGVAQGDGVTDGAGSLIDIRRTTDRDGGTVVVGGAARRDRAAAVVHDGPHALAVTDGRTAGGVAQVDEELLADLIDVVVGDRHRDGLTGDVRVERQGAAHPGVVAPLGRRVARGGVVHRGGHAARVAQGHGEGRRARPFVDGHIIDCKDRHRRRRRGFEADIIRKLHLLIAEGPGFKAAVRGHFLAGALNDLGRLHVVVIDPTRGRDAGGAGTGRGGFGHLRRVGAGGDGLLHVIDAAELVALFGLGVETVDLGIQHHVGIQPDGQLGAITQFDEHGAGIAGDDDLVRVDQIADRQDALTAVLGPCDDGALDHADIANGSGDDVGGAGSHNR